LFKFKDEAAEPVVNRHILRDATQKVHSLSEQRWAAIFDQHQGLQRFLCAMHNLHITFGIQAAKSTRQPHAIDLEQHRLKALNTDLFDCRFASEPMSATMPIGRDQAWGILYALNGSALGATSLLRPGAALAQEPSLYLGLMRDYVQSGGLGRFIRALNSEPLNLPKAISGANMVFAAMSQQKFSERNRH